MTQNRYSRRDFIVSAVAAPAMIVTNSAFGQRRWERTTIASPNGRIQFNFSPDPRRLRYFATLDNKKVIDWSMLAMSVDGTDISEEAIIGPIEHYQIRETNPARGAKSTAVNHCNGARFALQHLASKTHYLLEIRVFNNGAAFRFIVPGPGTRTPDEASTFSFPVGSFLWFHDFEGHYEGVHHKKAIMDVKNGEWAAPPLTAKLPSGGYAAITEAALVNYAGMGLRADGKTAFTTVLGHALPVSHPFDLRYGKDEAKRLAKPAAIEGTITTPWRVIMIGRDLNALVNCD